MGGCWTTVGTMPKWPARPKAKYWAPPVPALSSLMNLCHMLCWVWVPGSPGQQTGDTLRVRVFFGSAPAGCGAPLQANALRNRTRRVGDFSAPFGCGCFLGRTLRVRVIRSGALAGDTLGAGIFHHKLGLKQVQYAHNLPGREGNQKKLSTCTIARYFFIEWT